MPTLSELMHTMQSGSVWAIATRPCSLLQFVRPRHPRQALPNLLPPRPRPHVQVPNVSTCIQYRKWKKSRVQNVTNKI